MKPVDQAPRSESGETAGELVLENGKRAGARKALTLPATIVGRAPGCDIRLKGGGVEPLHCLLLQGPAGLQVRDLNTSGGTHVNDERVQEAALQDGDALKVGAYIFRVHQAVSAGAQRHAEQDALRVQAAAVAAQQAALGEEEARLKQRLEALEQQEEQLSSHLEAKRRKLLQLSERAQEERAALKSDRTAYEQHVERIAGDLTEAQRELLEQQQQVQSERRRLSALNGKLKARWQRHWATAETKYALRAEELANEECNLKKEGEQLQEQGASLARARLEFSSRHELGRRQLRDAARCLHEERRRWHKRRGQERAALHLRERELHEQELALRQAQQKLTQEVEHWQERRQTLERELDGLNQRARNQRDKILEQQVELTRLENLLRERRTTDGATPAPGAASRKTSAATNGDNLAQATPMAAAATSVVERRPRIIDLERLAADLAQQRLQLAEQWQHLVRTQKRWEESRDGAAAELEAMARPLQDHEQLLAQREQTCVEAEREMRMRQRELTRMHQHLVGWRAKLQAGEAAWEGERQRLLAEVRQREKAVEKQIATLREIRSRWARQRRDELDRLYADQSACGNLRQQCTQLQEEWNERFVTLEEEKRSLAEKTLALEQVREELVKGSKDPANVERRVERLRRRWASENAAALRRLAGERRALKDDLAALEARHAELRKLADQVFTLESRLADPRAQRDNHDLDDALRLDHLEHELKIANAQRDCTVTACARLKDEVEQIARTLMDEAEPPLVPADKAA